MDDDLIFEVPAEEMFEASGLVPPAGLLRNDAAAQAEHVAAETFAYTGVRVALVRSDSWSPKSRAPKLSTLREAALFLRHLADYDQEHFVVVCLDRDHRVLAVHEANVGGLSSAAVEQRQVFKVALVTGAHAVWVCHNHPSGIPEPSPDDHSMTDAVINTFNCLMRIRFMGHLIIADRGYSEVLGTTERDRSAGGGTW